MDDEQIVLEEVFIEIDNTFNFEQDDDAEDVNNNKIRMICKTILFNFIQFYRNIEVSFEDSILLILIKLLGNTTFLLGITNKQCLLSDPNSYKEINNDLIKNYINGNKENSSYNWKSELSVSSDEMEFPMKIFRNFF